MRRRRLRTGDAFAGAQPSPGPVPTPAPAPAPTPPPSASNCAAFHSGTYRIIEPAYGAAAQSETVDVDAASLQVTSQGGVTTLVANGTCRFTGNAAANPPDVLVSPAGVVVVRGYDDSLQGYRVLVGFPEQKLDVADLAGTWNMLGANLASGTSASNALYAGVAATATVSGTGDVSGISFCQGIATCAPVTDSISIRSDAAGGFDLVNATNNSTSRLFAYRAASGDVMMVEADDDGSITFFTKQHTNLVASVGSRSLTWGMWMNTSFVSTAVVSESSFTTTANDAAAGTWTRQSDTDGHLETLYANTPRAGYTYRPAGSAPTNTGNTYTFNEFTALGLAGMGGTVLWLPAIGQASAPGALFLSVTAQ